VVLMGILQIAVGRLHWGKFIRLVPHPVMLGFVNGLAIVIFLAQLSQFKVPGTCRGAGTGGGGEWLTGCRCHDARPRGADHGDHLGDAEGSPGHARAAGRHRVVAAS
jgi:hypothetical protein